VKDGEVAGVNRARVGFRAHADDVVYEVGDRDELLVELALKNASQVSGHRSLYPAPGLPPTTAK
jgi:hypothetical protein